MKAAADWMLSGPDWKLETEGIFRVQGGQGQVNSLKEQFDLGYYTIPEEMDTHTVATFFKNYLRTLSVKTFNEQLTNEIEKKRIYRMPLSRSSLLLEK